MPGPCIIAWTYWKLIVASQFVNNERKVCLFPMRNIGLTHNTFIYLYMLCNLSIFSKLFFNMSNKIRTFKALTTFISVAYSGEACGPGPFPEILISL